MILLIYLRAAKIRGLHDHFYASHIYLYTGIFDAIEENNKPYFFFFLKLENVFCFHILKIICVVNT